MQEENGLFAQIISTHGQLPKINYKFQKIRTLTLIQMIKEEASQIFIEQYQADHKDIIKRLANFLSLEKSIKTTYNLQLAIPMKHISQVNQKKQEALEFLEYFLNHIGSHKLILNDLNFKKFIQNNVPPDKSKLKTYKQLKMNKKGGGRHSDIKIANIFKSWSQKIFTICSQGIYYSSQGNKQIQQTIFFSQNFACLYGSQGTSHRFQIHLKSDQRILKLQSFGDNRIFKFIFFIYFLSKAMKESKLCDQKRFNSFSGIRQNCWSKYYIDGQNYFSDLHDCMLSAKKQIFITGWIISPFFCLKRPDKEQKTRLDKVLKNIASTGIKIKIILYWQPKIALNNASEQVAAYFHSLNNNIKVLRHPNSVFDIIWSHHQKIVIIDQKIAFLGGLDIGNGRMDNKNHLLSDTQQQYWPGVDYCNYRQTDILKPMQYTISSINRNQQPRMPWHDIAIQIKGRSVLDICHHFIQYWNFANLQHIISERQVLAIEGWKSESIVLVPEQKKQNKQYQMENDCQMEDLNQQIPSEILNFAKNIHSFKNEDEVQIIKFIQRLNNQKSRNGLSLDLIYDEPNQIAKQNNQRTQIHQIIRSSSKWGIGLQIDKHQKSIMNAYIELIRNSKEFIYIQNQFFICYQNTIADQIKARVRKACVNNEKFKIIIVLPSLPGFAGQPNSTLLRIQLHLQYDTLCRSKTYHSILQQLKTIPQISKISDVIQIFNLRTHGIINNKPCTQMVYVHSKLMIVDDQFVLMGSANINDRSLLGDRDSQIGIVVEDKQKIKLNINGVIKQVSKFAHELRKQLFVEHFGLKQQEVIDFMDDKLWNTIKQDSWRNHKIYKQIFGCYPDNDIKYFSQIQEIKNKAKPSNYLELIKFIKGHAVQFQSEFLAQQDLSIKATEMESIFFKGFT